ncbi:hypothetical protein Ycf19 family [Thermacetogenium phaeum DSM 12270]|uniref:YggT family protein n=1 Tax=Thermacetogenium phaeum (strain ATCC BAA-254 / DSM 26808 / PB) TaxID=1089553 RepID=K4LHF6_THEPS|nr:YggT family protein [Thermacetogenium phaeum]AFV11507.1 hypothetical protein Ycf19 family [Thermacetogenium phaeum DSM 12270]
MDGNFVIGIISIAVEIYIWLIVGRVLLSFLRPRTYHPIFRFIYEITEPVLAPLRRILPPAMNIDFSPLVAIIILEIVKALLISLLRNFI